MFYIVPSQTNVPKEGSGKILLLVLGTDSIVNKVGGEENQGDPGLINRPAQ